MKSQIWELPVPSTALLDGGVVLEKLLGRKCSLSFNHGGDDNNIISTRLLFDGVEAFKCTYHKACTLEMIESSYDKVVNLGATPWLNRVIEQLSISEQPTQELSHLMIYFDDGPCYEFICRSMQVIQDDLPVVA